MPPEPALDRWFPTAGDRPERDLALFCLPYAGGSSSAFRGWTAELRRWADVLPAQLPGREVRITEPPHVDVDTLTDALARAVGLRGRRPYALYGHSMGARLAFEVIVNLRRRGLPLPVGLFVGGSRPPHRDVPLARIARLPDEEFCARLVDLGGTPPGVLDEPELRELLLPILRADLALVESYAYRPVEPLPVPIVAFAGRDDSEAHACDMVGWSAHTSGPFELHTLPGDHFFLNSARGQLLGMLAGHLAARPESATGSRPVGMGLVTTPPAEDEVCVVEARLDDLPELCAATGELAPVELGHAAHGTPPAEAARTIGHRVLLRRILTGLGVDVGAVELSQDAPDAPGRSHHSGLRFDTGQCEGIALVALAQGRQVGVGVKRIRPADDADALVHRVLNAAERDEIAGVRGPDRLLAALRIRAARNAVRRASGDRLDADPDLLSFAGRTGGRTWRPRTGRDPARLSQWRVRQLDTPDAVVAVAVGADDWRLRYLTARPGTG